MRRAVLVSTSLLASVLLALIPASEALPTPGLACEEARATSGRLFPEADRTNDYIGYREARACLDLMASENPDLMTVHVAAQSAGWDRLGGGHDTFDVVVVEVTNSKSEVPRDAKLVLLFQLSIHGNEKGGREGGLRVIEDLVTGTGMAAANPDYVSYLDYMIVLFVFPNPDGWIHEEAEYRHNCPNYFAVPLPTGDCVESQHFVRVNGNGFDLNRNSPTVGWAFEPYQVLSQPETIGLVNFLKGNFSRIDYASDIHGMLQPADGQAAGVNSFQAVIFGGADPSQFRPDTDTRGHFVLTMLPAGRQDPAEMLKTTALAEVIKERLNANPAFAEWQAIPKSLGVWGGEFNDWGTVWDTISYTDSGFTSDFYAQDIGLNAPGVDFELAYNHVTFDNYYPGLAQRINVYHVEAVRTIIGSFMDQVAKDIRMSVDVKGLRTAYVHNPTIVTNADDGPDALSGWAAENPNDDAFDVAHRIFEATPNDYFVDLAKYARNGDAPATVDAINGAEISAARLAGYDNLVVAGSAYDEIAGKPAAIAAIRGFVENGGNLFVSDKALRLLEDLGIVKAGSVDVHYAYAGATNFIAVDHELAANIRGLARQTYEPVPLGYGIASFSAPAWFVKADAFDGDAVGVSGNGQGFVPDPTRVNLGRATLGQGTVSFLGAFLPDPTEEQYHPYGLDSYATTYTANQIFRNALGFDIVYEEPPVVVEDLGKASALDGGSAGTQGASGDANETPGLGILAALAAAAIALVAGRRRH